MPTAPMKVCGDHRCGVRVPSGETYCYEHARERTKKRLDKIKHNPFYSTQRWQKLRDWFIARHPVCVECGAAAEVVDHKVQISAGGAPLDEANLQSMCDYCHNRKRNSEARAARANTCASDPNRCGYG